MNTKEPEFELIEWRPLRKGDSMQGACPLCSCRPAWSSTTTLFTLAAMGRGGSACRGRPYKKDGRKSWLLLIDFADLPTHARFQRDALVAIDEYFAAVDEAKNAVR